jgi:hypothetical protein
LPDERTRQRRHPAPAHEQRRRRAQALALEQSVEMPLDAVIDARLRDEVVAQVLQLEARADGGPRPQLLSERAAAVQRLEAPFERRNPRRAGLPPGNPAARRLRTPAVGQRRLRAFDSGREQDLIPHETVEQPRRIGQALRQSVRPAQRGRRIVWATSLRGRPARRWLARQR